MSIINGIKHMALAAREHGLVDWVSLELPADQFRALREEISARYGWSDIEPDLIRVATVNGMVSVTERR